MPRTTVVYLSGFGRSGSTLVERFLGAAPGWTNIGELVDLARSVARDDELCGCGLRFSRCPLWTRVGELAFGGWDTRKLDQLSSLQRSAARQRHLPALLASRRPPSASLAQLRASYACIYRAVAEVTGSVVVVDASKGPALGAALSGSPDLDVRMLNVVRDPRAVAWSWTRRAERPHSTAGVQEMWRIPVHRAAAQWSVLQLEVEAVRLSGGVAAARLRYEDFVADPVGSLERSTGTLGLPLARADLPVVDGGQVVLDRSHGLSGNPGRFRSGEVALRADDGWRNDMPADSRALVTMLTLPLLRAYGYPLGTRPARATGPVDRRTSWSST